MIDRVIEHMRLFSVLK